MKPLLPWQMFPLDRWTIESLAHFYVTGQENEQMRIVFRCGDDEFEVSGPDDPLLWEEACRQAQALCPDSLPAPKDGARRPVYASPWEADQMRIILAWEAGELSEGLAARLLGLEIVELRELRLEAVAAGKRQALRRPPPAPVEVPPGRRAPAAAAPQPMQTLSLNDAASA